MVTSLSIDSPHLHIPHTRNCLVCPTSFDALSGCIPHTWGPVLLHDLAWFLWLFAVAVCSRSQPLRRRLLFGTGFTEYSQGLFQMESLRSAWIHTVLCLPSVSSDSDSEVLFFCFRFPFSWFFLLGSSLSILLSRSEGSLEIQVVYHIGITLLVI